MKTKCLLRPGLLLLWLVAACSCRQTESQTTIRPDLAGDGMANSRPDFKYDDVDTTFASATVWICKSAGAKRYHLNKGCGGLKKCRHTIKKTTRKEAEAIGLTLCKHEY